MISLPIKFSHLFGPLCTRVSSLSSVHLFGEICVKLGWADCSVEEEEEEEKEEKEEEEEEEKKEKRKKEKKEKNEKKEEEKKEEKKRKKKDTDGDGLEVKAAINLPQREDIVSAHYYLYV